MKDLTILNLSNNLNLKLIPNPQIKRKNHRKGVKKG